MRNEIGSAINELRRNLDDLGAVRDGCLRLLARPEGDGLELGPHDFDLEVTVSTGTGRPTRRPLTDFFPEGGPRLLAIHGKMADPRALLLATLAQIRQQIELMIKLSERIYDMQSMQQFEEEIVHAIDAADPTAGASLREWLHQRQTGRLAPGAPGGNE